MQELGKLGYKYQFVTLAGFHALNFGMFELACGYTKRGMAAYSELQQQEFAAEARGYTATKHQREVGGHCVVFLDILLLWVLSRCHHVCSRLSYPAGRHSLLPQLHSPAG